MTAYALAFGSLLLIGGRVADLIGRRAAILIGLAGFGLASALGGASVDLRMLIVARALQGVSGALLAPALLAVITTTFTDERERGKAFGIFGSVAIQEECSGMVQFLTAVTDQEYEGGIAADST
jgi:MFS family permease